MNPPAAMLRRSDESLFDEKIIAIFRDDYKTEHGMQTPETL